MDNVRVGSNPTPGRYLLFRFFYLKIFISVSNTHFAEHNTLGPKNSGWGRRTRLPRPPNTHGAPLRSASRGRGDHLARGLDAGGEAGCGRRASPRPGLRGRGGVGGRGSGLGRVAGPRFPAAEPGRAGRL